MAAVHPRTSPFASDDREFLLILAACSLGYALVVAALSFVPTPSRSTTDVASLPPRIAKLVLQAPPPTPAKRVVPAPEAASPSEAPVAPKPKAGTSAKKVALPPPPAPPSEAERPVDTEAALAEARLRLEAEAAAARERNRAVAKQSGLLKALAGGTGGASPGGNPAALDRVLSDISVLSNPALPPTGQGGGGPGLGGTGQHGLGGSGSGGGGGVSVEDVIAGLKGQGTGDAVVLAGRGSARVESALVVKGAGPTRSEESILRVLKGLNAWLKFQYHKAQRDQPALGSSITIEFTITPQGDVTDCRVASSALNDPPLENTILKRFCLLKFPPLEEGADDEVTVKYPIDFEGFS
jgi:TonB family protein